MTIPERFQELFDAEFQGRFRVRYSDARNEVHIEQKVGNGFAMGMIKGTPQSPRHYRARMDDMIRARDGYVLTFAVTPGTKTDCPRCGDMLEVPAYEFKHIQCAGCVRRGRDSWHAVGFFPLNDDLIQHLRKIDPHRGGIERVAQETADATAAAEIAKDKALRDPQEAAVRERADRILGVPKVGHTAPVFAGTEFSNYGRHDGA